MDLKETNEVIRAILGALGATITREPETGYWGGFTARLPDGECFFICAHKQGYGEGKPHRITLASSWGECDTYAQALAGRAERSRARVSSSCFLERGEESVGKPTFDPERPLPTLLKEAERRFFKRLRELWPRAEAYRALQRNNTDLYIDTVQACVGFKAQTKGGYSLTPQYIGHAGQYATFNLDIPKEKLAAFYVWCEENGVAR